MMTIKYTNTPQELFDYLYYVRTHNEDFKRDVKSTRTIYIVLAVILALYMGYQFYRAYTSTVEDDIASHMTAVFSTFIMLLVSVVFIFLVPALRRGFVKHDLKKELKKNGSRISEITLEINEKTFKWKGASTNGAMRITERREVLEADKAWYIEIHKPAANLVVPKRVMDEKQTAEFKHLLNIE